MNSIAAQGKAHQANQDVRNIKQGLADIDTTAERVSRSTQVEEVRTGGHKVRTDNTTAAIKERLEATAKANKEKADKKAADKVVADAKKAADAAASQQAAAARKAQFAALSVSTFSAKEGLKQGTSDVNLRNKLAAQGGSALDLVNARARAKIDAQNNAAALRATGGSGGGGGGGGGLSGSQALSMMPGGGALNRLGQMFPSVGRGIGAFGQWGSHNWGTATRIGPALPGAAQGALGGVGPGGGGFVANAGVGGTLAGTAGVLAGGLAMGAAGAMYIGEKGIGMTRDAFGSRRDRLIGMAATARAGSAMGGSQNLAGALKNMGGASGMADYGIDAQQGLSMQNEYLAARGNTETWKGSKDWREMSRYGLSMGVAGTGAGLGYTDTKILGMASTMHGAGAVPNAGMQSLFAHEQQAAGVGLLNSGVAKYNTDYARQLSESGYGGGQYGGVAAVQKLQGLGGGMAGSIRGQLGQAADTLAFVKGVKQAGSLVGGAEWTATASARKKMGALDDAGSFAPFAKWGANFSWQQATGRASRAAPNASDPNFGDRRQEDEVHFQGQMDEKAIASKALVALEKMDRNIALMTSNVAENTEFFKKYMALKGGAAGTIAGWNEPP